MLVVEQIVQELLNGGFPGKARYQGEEIGVRVPVVTAVAPPAAHFSYSQ